jgi:hypothetical protein
MVQHIIPFKLNVPFLKQVKGKLMLLTSEKERNGFPCTKRIGHDGDIDRYYC